MLNWPSYQHSETWDYQRLDWVDGAKFHVDVPHPLLPSTWRCGGAVEVVWGCGGGRGGWWGGVRGEEIIVGG